MRLHGGAQPLDPGTAACAEIVLAHVGGVQDRLRGEQAQLAQERDRLLGLARLARAAPGIELPDHTLEHHQFRLGLLVTGAGGLAGLLEPSLHDREIGERELARDHIMVAHRIDRPHDVHDIGIVEAAEHVDDGIHLADVR
jgi:hypothetical protein